MDDDMRANDADDDLIDIAEAARILGRSRQYVTMLIDRKRLEGVILTEEGHRKVPRSVVLKMKAEQQQKAPLGSDATNYRKAAQDAGMYEIPDEGYQLRLVPEKPDKLTDCLVPHPNIIVGDPDELERIDWSKEWRPDS